MKKRLFSITMLFFSVLFWAQENQTTTERVDAMVENLDRSQITSDILYDRTLPFAGLNKYDQNEEVRKTNFKHFKQAWSELQLSSYDFRGVPLKELKSSIAKDRRSNVVPLGFIQASIHSLNYNEQQLEESGVRLVEGKFETIRGEETFNEHQVFLASPLETDVHGPLVTFKLTDDYWFRVKVKQLDKVEVTLEGKTFTLIANGKLSSRGFSIDFEQTGTKNLEFTAIYQDGTSHKSVSELFVKVPSSSARSSDPLVQDFSGANGYDAPPSLAFQGYDESTAYQGHLDYRIYYRTNNGNTSTTLVRPLIVIDGFDPGDERKFEDADSPLPADEHISIVDFMTYFNSSGQPVSLLEELREEGFDVILVNHPTYTSGGKIIDGGADYIERNALTHVGFYQYISSLMSFTKYQIAIVAPSMGGQISRYALAYMEKNSIPHNVWLWISIDSPHLGANIPLGAQGLLDEAKEEGIDAAADFVDNQLNSPAAKQQLIEQYVVGVANKADPLFLNSRTESQGFHFDRGAPFFVQYYNNLFNNGLPESKGYPQNLRKIALVNGSLTNGSAYSGIINGNLVSGNFAGDGEKVLNIRGFNHAFPFPIHVASLEVDFLWGNGFNKEIARFKKAFDDDTIRATTSNNRGSMDNVAGGWFPTQYIIAEQTLAQMQFGLDDWDVHVLEPVSSFIPTFSALGHLSPNRNWSQPLNRNLVCENETPFDSFYGEAINTQHTSFNQNSVNWLMEELRRNQQAPSYPLDENSIVGEDCICGDDVETFTFCDIEGLNSWNASSNLTILSSTDSSVTVRADIGARAPGWIEATFDSGQVVRKDIWVGRPAAPSGSISGPSEPYYGALVNYTGGTAEGATSYIWSAPNPYIITTTVVPSPNEWRLRTGHTTRYLTAQVGPDDGLIQFKGVNKCGAGGAKTKNVSVATTGGGGDDGGIPEMNPEELEAEGQADLLNQFSVYPNPAQDFLIVEIPDSAEYSGGKIQIFGLDSRLLYELDVSSGRHQITTSQFPPNVYFLRFQNGKNTVVKKIVIE